MLLCICSLSSAVDVLKLRPPYAMKSQTFLCYIFLKHHFLVCFSEQTETIRNNSTVYVKTVYESPIGASKGLDLNLMRPAIDTAMSKADQFLPENINISHEYVFAGTEFCNGDYMGALAAEIYYTRHVSVFVGPACGFMLKVLCPMAASWNLPVVTGAGVADFLGDKRSHSTLTRVSFELDVMTEVLNDFLGVHYWSNIAALCDVSGFFWKLLWLSINACAPQGLLSDKTFVRPELTDFKAILKSFSSVSRGT